MTIRFFGLVIRTNFLNLCANGLSDLSRIRTAPQIFGSDTRFEGIFNRFHQRVRGLILTKPADHLCARPERADWIGHTFTGDVPSRPMDRLEHAWIRPGWIQVRRWRDSNGTGQSSSKVGEDVSMKVRRNDSVDCFRLKSHSTRHSVYQHLIRLDLGVILLDDF